MPLIDTSDTIVAYGQPKDFPWSKWLVVLLCVAGFVGVMWWRSTRPLVDAVTPGMVRRVEAVAPVEVPHSVAPDTRPLPPVLVKPFHVRPLVVSVLGDSIYVETNNVLGVARFNVPFDGWLFFFDAKSRRVLIFDTTDGGFGSPVGIDSRAGRRGVSNPVSKQVLGGQGGARGSG